MMLNRFIAMSIVFSLVTMAFPALAQTETPPDSCASLGDQPTQQMSDDISLLDQESPEEDDTERDGGGSPEDVPDPIVDDTFNCCRARICC